jgi:uncharacterized protein
VSRLDPRGPFVLDTRELGRRPGEMRRFSRTVPAPDDMRLDMVQVPPGSDLDLDLRLESVMEGVLVSGTARARIVGECVRCLERVEDELTADLQELFAYPGDADPEDPDAPRVEGDFIDLEPVLRDSVVTALPWRPLCSEECAGLCPECGARLVDNPDHTHDGSTDPRWAALSGLLHDGPQQGSRQDESH